MRSILNKKFRKRNKKAQALSVVFFFIIILAVLVLAVLLMSLVNTILEPFREQIAPLSNESATAVATIQSGFNNTWDWVIVMLF